MCKHSLWKEKKKYVQNIFRVKIITEKKVSDMKLIIDQYFVEFQWS